MPWSWSKRFIRSERLLELALDVGIELDSGLEPPEQVRREAR